MDAGLFLAGLTILVLLAATSSSSLLASGILGSMLSKSRGRPSLAKATAVKADTQKKVV